MSTATTAMGVGFTELLSQLGEAFTFGGVAFTAVVDLPSDRPDELHRGYGAGNSFDVTLTVDPTVAAFSGGLPTRGQTVTHTSSSRLYPVLGIEYAPGSHVATLQCRRPA